MVRQFLVPADAALLRLGRAFYEPRSVSLFLVLVPGLTVGAFSLVRAGLAVLVVESVFSFWNLLGAIWFSRALGIGLLTPLLVLLLSPRAHGEWEEAVETPVSEPDPGLEPSKGLKGIGDSIEIAGLTLGTGLFEMLLALAYGHTGLANWQVWGVPLLLVIWASFRQGPLGGLIAAAGSAAFPLALAVAGLTHMPALLIQGHLLAQCTTALLVSSSAAWIRSREVRYRRVVQRIPVVLYSTRVAGRPSSERPNPEAGAEGMAAPLLATLFDWTEITFVSPACRELMGRAPEQLMGPFEKWLDQVLPADREIVLAALTQLSRQHEPVTCEYRLHPLQPTQRPDRRKPTPLRTGPRQTPLVTSIASQPPDRWARDTMAPHFSADGRLDGWDSVVLDIMEQRRLADDLRRTSSMFHVLVANLPAGVFFVHGTSGRPILVNARARQLLGRREDTGAGLEHLSRVYQLHRPGGTPYPVEELPVWMALRNGLTTMRDDIVVHRPDGRRVPLVTWAAPIDLVGRGQLDAAVWVLEDLTTLRQAEAALRDSEARLRTVIETMAEGLIVQNDREIITECNPAACRILGLPADQIRGRSLSDPEWRCVREDGSPFAAEDQPATVSLRTGQPVRNVIMGVSRQKLNQRAGDLDMGWILVNAMPMSGNLASPGASVGRPQHYVVTTFVDITAHLRTLEGFALRRSATAVWWSRCRWHSSSGTPSCSRCSPTQQPVTSPGSAVRTSGLPMIGQRPG